MSIHIWTQKEKKGDKKENNGILLKISQTLPQKAENKIIISFIVL